ncbi:ABC-type molybdenum transport system, ATPase component/photorepair protein PhrA [Thermoplasmatales archaeon BRNA1]|nr:ABC-type molybdenum transport system, ATPase component/photorepair protein PhrA [Thermoplasmatales archaeon BRNA1]
MEKALELRNVSVVRGGVRILDGIDLDIGVGENVAIIGLNGSGKTTLLKLLRGDIYPYDDDAGYSMRVFGEKRWSIWDLRSKMGVVSMDLQSLFNEHTTVREVIGSGFFGSLDIFRNVTVTEKMEELILCRASEMGIEDLMHREIGGLSLGEMRRTLIARALITNPRMLILDEPMTGLDIVMKSKFRQMFDILTGTGVSIVMITHDLTDIPVKLDRVVMIRDGRIYADGRKSELLNDETVSGVYGAPIKVECTDGIYRMHIRGDSE